MRDDADFALIFQDEMEIHRHPALTRMWAPVGQQPEVPAPGKNEKKVVYGGVDYQTGQLAYTVADSKCGGSFLAFLAALLLAYAGKKIRLVCDNGRFHTTKAVQAFLEEHREQIEVYWLPPYCPSLNLIERGASETNRVSQRSLRHAERTCGRLPQRRPSLDGRPRTHGIHVRSR